MLRYGEQIRFTPAERGELHKMLGGAPIPKTVEAFNRRVAEVAALWRGGDSAEEKLYAAVILDWTVPDDELANRAGP